MLSNCTREKYFKDFSRKPKAAYTKNKEKDTHNGTNISLAYETWNRKQKKKKLYWKTQKVLGESQFQIDISYAVVETCDNVQRAASVQNSIECAVGQNRSLTSHALMQV